MGVEIKQLAKGILDDAYLMTLAITDASGSWAAPVIFVTDSEMRLYWLSLRNTRHSQAIAAGQRVGISVVAEWTKGSERALQSEADAIMVNGDLFEQEVALRTKIGDMPPAVAGETTGEHSWYMAAPRRIELIDDQHFGWNRQRVL